MVEDQNWQDHPGATSAPAGNQFLDPPEGSRIPTPDRRGVSITLYHYGLPHLALIWSSTDFGPQAPIYLQVSRT
jgi:hypothetical protein